MSFSCRIKNKAALSAITLFLSLPNKHFLLSGLVGGHLWISIISGAAVGSSHGEMGYFGGGVSRVAVRFAFSKMGEKNSKPNQHKASPTRKFDRRLQTSAGSLHSDTLRLNVASKCSLRGAHPLSLYTHPTTLHNKDFVTARPTDLSPQPRMKGQPWQCQKT